MRTEQILGVLSRASEKKKCVQMLRGGFADFSFFGPSSMAPAWLSEKPMSSTTFRPVGVNLFTYQCTGCELAAYVGHILPSSLIPLQKTKLPIPLTFGRISKFATRFEGPMPIIEMEGKVGRNRTGPNEATAKIRN